MGREGYIPPEAQKTTESKDWTKFRELVVNPEALEMLEERDKAIERRIAETEEFLDKIEKEIEEISNLSDLIEADNGRVVIDKEELSRSIEEYRTNASLLKRLRAFSEHRINKDEKKLEWDDIQESETGSNETASFCNPINVIEDQAPSIFKKIREIRYKVDRRYREKMEEMFDETMTNLGNYDEEAIRLRKNEIVQQISRLEEKFRSFEFSSGFNIKETREERIRSMVRFKREVKELISRLNSDPAFVDCAANLEDREKGESNKFVIQNWLERLKILQNDEEISRENVSRLKEELIWDIKNKIGDLGFFIGGQEEYTLFGISSREDLVDKFIQTQDRAGRIISQFKDEKLVDCFNKGLKDKGYFKGRMLESYKIARRRSRDIFTHGLPISALEDVVRDGKLKSMRVLEKEGRLTSEKMAKTTRNMEGQVFFNINEIGITWCRTGSRNNFVFVAGLGADIFASGISIEQQGLKTHYSGSESSCGMQAYDPENPGMTEFRVDEMQIIVPEGKKDHWLGLLEEQGYSKNWINSHIIFIPDRIYEGAGDIQETVVRYHEYFLDSVFEQIRARSRNMDRLFFSAPGKYNGRPKFVEAGTRIKGDN